MDAKNRTAASKFLSFVLRHEPDAIGVTLDAAGWVDVDVLLQACAKHGRSLSRNELDEIAATNPKRRFAFSEDARRIRANQGHSTAVDLCHEPAEPPDVLFHGTIRRLLPVPALLRIDARAMHNAGHSFFRTGRGRGWQARSRGAFRAWWRDPLSSVIVNGASARRWWSPQVQDRAIESAFSNQIGLTQ